MRFVKFQAFGNDYIVFEAEQLREVPSLGDFAARICEPHYGAGADGITIVEKAADEGADFDVRIFNPDGSEAGLSGNGTRIAAAYLHHQGLWHERALRLRTTARTTLYHLRDESASGGHVFDSELGRPTFDHASIPFADPEAPVPIRDYPIALRSGEALRATCLSVGNPHCAFFVEDFESVDWRRVGAEVECLELFPERTNLEFIRVIHKGRIELRIWERGVGETHSSGTCSSAAAIACVVNDMCGRDIEVSTPGGNLRVVWRADDDVIVLTGRADVVYEATWLGRRV